MALTGIEIFKLLPKTNCGACGVPTCLAFAMNLAAGKAELAKCPHVSEEAKSKLSEAAAPPILPVTIGAGETALKIGGETVMFRHEKRFENPPGIAILISDKMSDAEVDARLKKVKDLTYERVGLTLRANLVALKSETGDAAKFAALASKVKTSPDINVILMSDKVDVLTAGAKACADRKPLLYAATKDNVDAVAALAKETGCAVVAKANGMDDLAALTEKLAAAGLKNIVIDAGARGVRKALEDQIIIRSAALNKKFRALGYPTIVFPCEMTDNPMKEALIAAMFIAKYAGIIVLSDFQGESLFPLLVARLNIYTDPQRPLATKQGIYEINNPNENSPLMVTSNFSLTYFIVSGEIENSKVPSWLYVKDTEGLSVMTSWAAGKFSADIIGPAILKSGITDKIKHRKLIIPGYIAAESGGLEEEMKGWEIQVGPRDAANLTPFLKAWKA
ncbi:MAG: acetyl-CoA decarbonylase/synthase complex subunit gamma [Chloroflexi bacterium RBG_16_50_11]|nr:MAG: acetyl-CoA decarbonylase/synthase complex subunit gamma [Chloroflexi bacterium RBG_16_50_11]